jgi:hypothetical protein
VNLIHRPEQLVQVRSHRLVWLQKVDRRPLFRSVLLIESREDFLDRALRLVRLTPFVARLFRKWLSFTG